jgi:hypothetical protein
LTANFTPPYEAVSWAAWEREGLTHRTEFGSHGMAWPTAANDALVGRLLGWLAEPPRWVRQGLSTAQKLAALFESDCTLLEKVRERLAAVRLTVAPFVPVPRTKRRLNDLRAAWEEGRAWEFLKVAVAYEVPDAATLAVLEVVLAAKENLPVKKCPTCGIAFVPVPGNAKYCDACRADSTRQQLYYRRKKEAMSEADLKKLREYWRQKKRKERATKRAK